MSPQSPVDSDVAVLKSQVGELQSSLSSMRDSVNTQLSHLTARFDIFAELVRDMTRMQEKQTTQSETMGRAFSEIREVRAEIAGHLEARDVWRETHTRETNEYRERILQERDAWRLQHILERDEWRAAHLAEHVEISRKANRAHGWILGAGAVVALLVGMLGWMGSRALDKLDSVDDKANDNQVQLLQHRLEEATEKVRQGNGK